MPEQTKKLIHFTNAVVHEAQEQARQAEHELERKHAAALAEIREKLRDEAIAHARAESARIRAEAGREISRHLMECKREIYLRRTQIGAEVCEKVTQRLEAFTKTPEYPALLQRQLTDAVGKFGLVSEVVVYLRPEDMHLAPQLEQAIKPVAVQFREGGFTLGGIVVDCPEIGQCADGAYDTALLDLAGHFAEQFGLSLSNDLTET